MVKWYQGTMPLNYICWRHLISYTNTTSRVENTIRGWSTQGRVGGGMKESLGGVVMPRPSNPDPVFKRQNQFITCIWPCLKEGTFLCGPHNNYGGHKSTSTLLFFNLESQWAFSVINTEQTSRVGLWYTTKVHTPFKTNNIEYSVIND